MGLFGKSKSSNRCPECRFYVMVSGHGYCAKELPESVNVRLLSQEALKRQCPRCPDKMTCDAWAAK